MLSSKQFIRKALSGVRHLHASSFRSAAALKDSDVVILSAVRTPIGAFNGSLSSLSCTQLGTHVIKHSIDRAGIQASDVNEVIMGNVVSSGAGQAPATQATFRAGVPYNVPSTTINKVCASGLKAIGLASASIQIGMNNVVVAGGMESMSQIPFYLPKGRSGYGLGHGQVLDGIIQDGLWDPFDNHHMGNAAEFCADQYKFSRQAQDEYALESFRRALKAQKEGLFKEEIAPVTIASKTGNVVVSEDESPAKLKVDKVPTLKPAFKPNGGSVTAANSSSINDGASALIIASAKWAKERNLTPLARILGFADAQRKPVEFTIAPSLGIPLALQRAGLSVKDVDFFEINEAFAVVSMANMKILDIPHSKLNVNGGAVALGHPIGCSGARIVTTLINVLKQNKGRIGVASICNGGGGASSIVIEKL